MALVRSIVARLHPSLNSPCRCEGWSRQEVGAFGEKVAGLYIERAGGVVLYRGFRAPHGGEVDLICRGEAMLCFVEVKTRRSLAYGRPVEAVNKVKQRLITRGAMEWLRRMGDKAKDVSYRYDVVEVILTDGERPDVTWLKNVFND